MSKENKSTKFQKGNKIGNRFSVDNQPKKNGRKGKQITQHLKAIGNASSIEFDIKITDSNGKVKHKKGSIDTGEDRTMNELLGAMMWTDAIKGNYKAQKEIIDRIEGRSQTHVDITTQGESVSLTPEDRKSKIANLMSKFNKQSEK